MNTFSDEKRFVLFLLIITYYNTHPQNLFAVSFLKSDAFHYRLSCDLYVTNVNIFDVFESCSLLA